MSNPWSGAKVPAPACQCSRAMGLSFKLQPHDVAWQHRPPPSSAVWGREGA